MIDDLDNVDYAFQQNLELSLLIQVSKRMEFALSILGLRYWSVASFFQPIKEIQRECTGNLPQDIPS